MSSTTRTTSHNKKGHQKSIAPSEQTKKSDDSKKLLLHQLLPSPPPEDWVLFPGDVVVEKYSSISHASTRKLAKTGSAKQQMSPMPHHDHHVTENKAAARSRLEPRKPYRRSTCLEHLSAINCTARCFDTKPLADPRMPPAAPLPPRLPTPDLSDVEEDEFWSCCKSFNRSARNVSNDCTDVDDEGDGVWDEMGKRSRLLRPQRATNDNNASRRKANERSELAKAESASIRSGYFLMR